VSSGEPTQLSEVVTTLASLLDSDPEQILELTKERRDEPKMLIGESLKLRELGWKPILSLTQGLERDLRKE
jgi:nucleoside-diphosphate-sugar epimerase